MHRFFATNGLIRHEENTHLTRVLRLREGDEIELLDGGHIFLARLTEIGKDASRAETLLQLPTREAAFSLTLYVGLLKGEKMDWVVQKATELGASAIRPVLMERSVAKDGKPERWRRIAREAQKQCGRALCPEIGDVQPLRALREPLRATPPVVPYEGGGIPFADAVRGGAALSLLIGPEGGIAPGEIDFLREQGARLATLGPRILRAETAALAVVSAAMALRGAWAGEA